MYVSELSEKIHEERCKNPPPAMIEGKTTDQAMWKIRCMLNKNVSLVWQYIMQFTFRFFIPFLVVDIFLLNAEL